MLATTSPVAPPCPAAEAAAAPRLLDQVRAAARARHYSPLTEQVFVSWIRRYVLFHDKRHPAQMAEPEVVRFLSHLAVEERVSPSLQSQARAALVFLYRHVLHQRRRTSTGSAATFSSTTSGIPWKWAPPS